MKRLAIGKKNQYALKVTQIKIGIKVSMLPNYNDLQEEEDEQAHQPHLGLVLLITFLFGIPTISWFTQLNAALNQPYSLAVVEDNTISLGNSTGRGEMF